MLLSRCLSFFSQERFSSSISIFIFRFPRKVFSSLSKFKKKTHICTKQNQPAHSCRSTGTWQGLKSGMPLVWRSSFSEGTCSRQDKVARVRALCRRRVRVHLATLRDRRKRNCAIASLCFNSPKRV